MDKAQAEKALSLSGTYTLVDARAAYRALAKKYHPDMRAESGIDDAMAEVGIRDVNEAFDYLEALFRTSGKGTLECSAADPAVPTIPPESDFVSETLSDMTRRAKRARKKSEGNARQNKERAEAREQHYRTREATRCEADEERVRNRALNEQLARRKRIAKIAIATCSVLVVILVTNYAGNALHHDFTTPSANANSQTTNEDSAFSGAMRSEQGRSSEVSTTAVEKVTFPDLLGSYEDDSPNRRNGRFASFDVESVKESGNDTATVTVSWTWQPARGNRASGIASGFATIDHMGPNVVATLNLYGTSEAGEKFQFRGSCEHADTIEYGAIVGNSPIVRDGVLKKF